MGDAAPPPAVLILGATGYVGQFVVQALLARGRHRLHAVRRPASRDVSGLPEEVQRHVADYTDVEAIAAVLREVRPSVVVNCAAMSALGACEKDPAGAAAANCPRGLVEAVAREAQGAPRLFIHFSTDIVFDGDPSKVYDEESPPSPVNTYGRLKADFDSFLAGTAEPVCVVLRPTNIIGPKHPFVSTGTKFLQWLDGQLSNDAPTKLFEDEFRNYVWVEDLVAVVVRLVEDFPDRLPPHRLMHCGGPEALSRVGVARELLEAKGYSATYKDQDGAERPRIVPTPRADVDLGYDSPLCVRVRSTRAEAYLGRPFQLVGVCIKEHVSRI